MNGSIILAHAREQLAEEIFGYREPKPAPLKISPWLAMSLLQKAIRRGEAELAQHAAATLLLIAPDRLWRRCGAAVFEEVGVADLQTVALVTTALGGKRYRAGLGGDWRVASFIVDRMVNAPKCRGADDLLLTADLHPLYRQARADLANKTTRDLIRIATGDAALPVRALAAWYAVGTHPRQTKHLSPRRGEPSSFFDGLCEAGLPHTVVEIAREGFRKIGEPLCPFVALLAPLASLETSMPEDDVMVPEIMVGEVPGWAYDMYSREGRTALQVFLQGDSESARWVRERIAKPQRLHFLGTIVFRVEGGLVRRRSTWPTGDGLRRLVDYECNGPQCADAIEILQLMKADVPLLNCCRGQIIGGREHVQ
jgi:hypothetical protein